MTTAIAVAAALLAGLCFAVAALVQQTVARATGADEAMHPRLLLDLARRPRWLAGIGLDAISFLILALAWHSGRWPWSSRWPPWTCCSRCRSSPACKDAGSPWGTASAR